MWRSCHLWEAERAAPQCWICLLKPVDHLNLPQPGQLILLTAHGRATRLPPPSLHQGPGHTDGCRKGETLVERQFAASSITDSLGSTAQGRALSMLIDTEGPDRSGVCIFLPWGVQPCRSVLWSGIGWIVTCFILKMDYEKSFPSYILQKKDLRLSCYS